MKRNKFIISALVGFAVLILSCSKDESQNAILHQGLQTRTSTPITINGMLSFPTYQDFENFVSNLKNQEQDSTTVRNAFTTLGIDLNVEQTTNITDYPVCRITENGISGFTSARRIEEDAINADLNAGGDAFSIIEDVYLKTALNSDMSVHIGTRIFKYFDNERLVIVLNNDWNAYNTIKNSTYDQLNSNLQNVLITSTDKTNWSWIYNLNSQGEMISEKEIVVPDVSAVPGCDLSTSFVKTTLSNGDIRFQLNLSFTPPIIEWIFSDGTILTGNPVTRPCSSSGTVKVILRNSDGRIICISTNVMSYLCYNCGVKRTRNDELIRNVNGETWRIQASIWVRSGQVGCSMSYRRKRLGIWVPASNRGVCTDLSGTYKRELANKSCIDVSANGIECLGNGTFPTSISVTIPDIDKIFREPNKLTSGHRVNVKGTWFGFGINGVPRLILD
jgi:hypothetical protein